MVEWLRELNSPIDRFHQARVLLTPAGADQDTLLSTLQALLDTHDMLRSRLNVDEDGRWNWETTAPGSVRAEDLFRRVPFAERPEDELT